MSHGRRVSAGVIAALTLAAPASAGAFPYLTVDAGRRAIERYEFRRWQSHYPTVSVYGCQHPWFNVVQVRCKASGRWWWWSGRAWYAYRWGPEQTWAEVLPNGQIEAG